MQMALIGSAALLLVAMYMGPGALLTAAPRFNRIEFNSTSAADFSDDSADHVNDLSDWQSVMFRQAPRKRRRKTKPDEAPLQEECGKRTLTFARADVEIVSERPLRLSMLSNGLKRKFGHLCTEA